MELGSGEPAARHRKVTTAARWQLPLGLKVVSVAPVVMPFSTAQRTGSM